MRYYIHFLVYTYVQIISSLPCTLHQSWSDCGGNASEWSGFLQNLPRNPGAGLGIGQGMVMVVAIGLANYTLYPFLTYRSPFTL